MAATDYATAVLNASPSAYWKLDDTSGNFVDQVSSNAHPLTAAGSPTYSQTGAMSGSQAVYLSGAAGNGGSYTDWGSDFTLPVTVMAWVNLASTPQANHYPVLSIGSSASVRMSFMARRNSTGNYVSCWDSGGSGWKEFSNHAALATDGATWYHLTYIRTSTDVSLYLDGSFVQTVAGNLSITAWNDLCVGFSLGTTSERIKGTLDDVAFWSGTALNSTQISTIYDAASASGGTQHEPTISANPENLTDKYRISHDSVRFNIGVVVKP